MKLSLLFATGSAPPPVHGRLATADGNVIAYVIYGDPSLRKPVFYLHGVPGSRLEAELAHLPSFERGISLIAVDRPGFGDSTFNASRTLLDTPKTITALADHLGLAKFGMIGVSGGGPHAAACAQLLGTRVIATSLVSSLAPFGEFHTHTLSVLRPYLRFLRATTAIGGMLTRMIYRGLRRTSRNLLERIDAKQPKADLALLKRPHIAAVMQRNIDLIDGYEEGLIHELTVLSDPWGFFVEQIDAPVHIWHGTADPTVPLEMGSYLAKHIPKAKRHFSKGLGHLLILHRLPEILEVMRLAFPVRKVI